MTHYPFFLGTGDVWFTLRNTTYQNNSIVTLEDIGEGDNALICITDLPTCCRPPYTGEMGLALGNWFFPNETRVPSSSNQWDFHRTRGQMVVRLHHRRGGVEGMYRCEIPDTMNVTQTIYIRVYSASTGEWMYTLLFCLTRVILATFSGLPTVQFLIAVCKTKGKGLGAFLSQEWCQCLLR